MMQATDDITEIVLIAFATIRHEDFLGWIEHCVAFKFVHNILFSLLPCLFLFPHAGVTDCILSVIDCIPKCDQLHS